MPARYAGYEPLVEDSAVDVVYVATPHTLHRDNTLLALGAGKHVLVEKPMAVNARQAEDIVEAARQNDLFLMEAMWSRFLPVYDVIRDWLGSGRIGQPVEVHADFGFVTDLGLDSRIFQPNLAGGALLDVGIYPVALADLAFGVPPQRIESVVRKAETGVDETSTLLLDFGEGRSAHLFNSVRQATPQRAWISGTAGRIDIAPPFFYATEATLTPHDGDAVTENRELTGNGYNYEAAEVAACLRAGQTESPKMTLDDSLEIMRTLDRIRESWGLRYPME